MTDDEFWQLISRIDANALASGSDDDAIRPLEMALCEKTEAELLAFEELLATKLYALDGEIYAKNSDGNGCSGDPFLYARLYVVAQGRKHYEDVLPCPEKMPKSIYQWCEALLHPQRRAWATITGRDQSEWPFVPSVSYESGSNPELWPR